MQAMAWIMAALKTGTLTMKNTTKYWVSIKSNERQSQKQKPPFPFNRIKNVSQTNEKIAFNTVHFQKHLMFYNKKNE